MLLILLICKCAVAQRSTWITGYPKPYLLVNNKIYEDTIANTVNLIAVIQGNKIYDYISKNHEAVLYTVMGGAVYKTATIITKNLLFYVKQRHIFLRTKKGGFEDAGKVDIKPNGAGFGMIAYLEPLECFSLLIMYHYN